jgi:hypothetical protein
VPAVIVHGITGEQTPHERWQPLRTAPQQDMRMIAHEAPSIDGRGRRSSHLPQAVYERLSIPAIIHHLALLDSPHHHMMQGPRRIQSSLPRHPSFTTSLSRASSRRSLCDSPKSRIRSLLSLVKNVPLFTQSPPY